MFQLLALIILLLCSETQVRCLNDEGFALLAFKRSIAQDPEGSLSNWNYSDRNPCLWNGITCKGERVISIAIPKKKLIGFLSSAIGSLSYLRHVNFRNNKLYGPLPVELLQVQGLQSLVLYGNSFSGPLSYEIGKLNYLQNLDLSQNTFNGSLPSSIVDCKRLRTLVLGQNNFSGPLPDGFGASLLSLEKLDLSYNRFNGAIPSDMGNMSNLEGTVDLSHNLFSGSIPSSLGYLPEKVYIDLTFNNLSGPIPQNGGLMNRGPTAFIGNPGLCGPPLKVPCYSDAVSPSSYPYMPNNSSPQSYGDNAGNNKGRGLSKGSIAAIVVSDIIGICLIGLLFSYCCTRSCGCIKSEDELDYGVEKGGKKRKECSCFRKDESETLSENVEQYDLVPLDTHVSFDLDELLKASAFVLGKSGIGIVYKVVLEDGLTLAVRRLGEGGSQRLKEFQTEVEAIGKLRHPNIVTLKAYYWSADEKLLIYEFVPNGNLDTALHGKPGMVSFEPLPWSTRLQIMKGTAKGLVYLHEFSPKRYVHGDLKPSNILLERSMEPKISDFGLGRLANIAGTSPALQSSRLTSEKPQQKKQQPGSTMPSEVASISAATTIAVSYYQAPEALKTVKPSQKWDVYSYGVILLEMITGRSPLVQVGTTELDLVQWIQHCIDEKKPLVDVLDPILVQELDKEDEIVAVLKIAIACVNISPEKRPPMRHVSDALNRLSETGETY